MKSKFHVNFILILIFVCFNGIFYLDQHPLISDEIFRVPDNTKNEFNKLPKPSSIDGEFSHYNISVIFDPSTSSVFGNMTVNFYNNDPINITRIPFHLFLSGMQYLSRMGNTEILNVQTISQPKTPLTFEVNETAQLLWVNLNTELKSNERVFFEIEFNSVIPDGGIDRANSHGSGNSRIYKFSCFYPMPCVYDSFDAWNTDPYLAVGDPFYYDMAYYNVFIEAPYDFVIAATGKLIEMQNKSETIIYHFDPLYPVREITFSASQWFIEESTSISGVIVSTYFLPKSQSLWQINALNFSNQALFLFNDTFGEYPYPTLNIVEEYTHYGGMEYPCQVYISESIDSWSDPLLYLEKVIVHEIGHQWWYNLIGNDEIDWGFLDEGLTCWSTDYYGEIIHGNWEYFQYYPYIDEVRTYHLIVGLPSKINSSVYECIDTGMDYWYIAYHKTPLIFEKLRKTIGNSYFLAGLQRYFEENKFKIALLSDLQQAMESTCVFSLDWFFFSWFDNLYIPKYNGKYNFLNEDQTSLLITINDLNEPLNNYVYYQQVQLIIENANEIIYNEWIWINGTTTIEISLSSKPVTVRLEYGDEVIVQLNSPYSTFLYIKLEEIPNISGYNISILIFCLLLISFLFKMYSFHRKNKSKN